MALVAAAGAQIGCRQPSGLESLLGDRAPTPPPSSSGSCELDLDGAAGDNVFVLLGMLDEYQGRVIVEDEDVVEHFYCNEAAVADVFHDRLLRLVREQGLDPAIRTEAGQGCAIVYRSRAVADRLNSCYRYTASSEILSQAPDGTFRRIAKASLGLELFLQSDQDDATDAGPAQRLDRRRALAYLAGAWVRYGSGSDFVFTNAQSKARLIVELLTHLGCRDVRLESTSGLIPQTTVVRFEPTTEVAEWLQAFPSRSARQAAVDGRE